MGRVADLAATVGVVPVLQGSLVLLSASDAVQVIEAAGTRGVRVLGMEGFRVVGQRVEPDMDSILDLSEVVDEAASVTEATAFLLAQPHEGLMFDLALDDPEEVA